MPVIDSSFRPPLLLSNGHVQTILGAFVQPARLALTRERMELPDGDFLDLDWHRSGYRRLVILSHGLEGSSSAAYIKGTARALNTAGWDALAWNMRGCSGELNRLARSYHSGATEDLRSVIEHAARQYQSIALVGFSLGGNVTLKYLGEAIPHPSITSAACVSVPVNLRASADALDQHFANRLYLHRFLTTMVKKMQEKARRFPGQITEVEPSHVHTLRQFDDLFTAPLHGFMDAEDYWAKCSARQFLGNLTVPTLLINARNDSFLTLESMPFQEATNSKLFHFEAPASGGHVGFLETLASPPWYQGRIVEFLR